MTREEAANWFEAFMLDYHDPMEVPDDLPYEVAEVAISALRPVRRETVERMRGKWIKPHWKNNTSCAVCSQCGFEAHHHEYHGVQDTYLFCPRCMAPMMDEAVQMVMERWEALKDDQI